ncbi:MAG: hypothetical protein AB8F95_22290 [Bacteroidia bacterium]
MKRNLAIIFLVGSLAIGCGLYVSKEKAISDFETRIAALCDQSNVILDAAIADLENGEDVAVISAQIKKPLRQLEHQIDSVSRAFAPIAKRARIPEDEYNEIFKELDRKTMSMTDKFIRLEVSGVEL